MFIILLLKRYWLPLTAFIDTFFLQTGATDKIKNAFGAFPFYIREAKFKTVYVFLS
jgi:hypothetical protein